MSDRDLIEAFVEGTGDTEGFDGSWDEFAWECQPSTYRKKDAGLEVPGVGLVTVVEDFGGEGQGDTRYIVLAANGRFYQKDGYYASYDGSTWDGDFYEVKPVEKTVTVFEKV